MVESRAGARFRGTARGCGQRTEGGCEISARLAANTGQPVRGGARDREHRGRRGVGAPRHRCRREPRGGLAQSRAGAGTAGPAAGSDGRRIACNRTRARRARPCRLQGATRDHGRDAQEGTHDARCGACAAPRLRVAAVRASRATRARKRSRGRHAGIRERGAPRAEARRSVVAAPVPAPTVGRLA